MKKHSILVAVSFLLVVLFEFNAYGVPDLKLPYKGGEVWWVSQGNNSTPTHSGNLTYAWDFNWGAGNADRGRDVIAPASGTIVYAGLTYDWQGNRSNWGNVVIIDYGDGSFGKLAHLLNSNQYPLMVRIGDYVSQGQTVGYCGGTGLIDERWPVHIHYQTQNSSDVNGKSISSSFVDVDTNNGVPLGCGCAYDDGNHRYLSTNYFSPSTHFNFAGKNPQGWTCGFDCEVPAQNQTDPDTFRIATDDFDASGENNPGFVSPTFGAKINTAKFCIQARHLTNLIFFVKV